METNKKRANLGGLSVTYVVVIAILAIIVFLALKKIGLKLPQKTPQPASTAQQVLITIEGTLGQPVAGAEAYYLNTNAGFMTLSYSSETAFANEKGEEITISSLKPGVRIRAEGKPNGNAFEANKITILSEKPKATPTKFSLPHTGITE